MISGAHVVIYSTEAEKDRAFLREVIGLSSVDAGGGWSIFELPPAEVAVHPAAAGDRHELYLLTDSIDEFVGAMRSRGVACEEPQTLPWGVLTSITLPGGGRIGVYQPRHARPTPAERPRV
jgi:hypothetical protein